jgi:hypothetical protein
MRVPACLAAGLIAAACTATPAPAPDSHDAASANDCAVIAAVAKEHYEIPKNPAPPLKPLEGYTPACDWAKCGLAFTPYTEGNPAQDPRERLKWIAFGKPAYDAQGATLKTEIMHGPLAGMGYECRLHSGFAGWTVGECRTSWVS